MCCSRGQSQDNALAAPARSSAAWAPFRAAALQLRGTQATLSLLNKALLQHRTRRSAIKCRVGRLQKGQHGPAICSAQASCQVPQEWPDLSFELPARELELTALSQQADAAADPDPCFDLSSAGAHQVSSIADRDHVSCPSSAVQQLGPCPQQVSRLRACGEWCLPHLASVHSNGPDWVPSEVRQAEEFLSHVLLNLSRQAEAPKGACQRQPTRRAGLSFLPSKGSGAPPSFGPPGAPQRAPRPRRLVLAGDQQRDYDAKRRGGTRGCEAEACKAVECHACVGMSRGRSARVSAGSEIEDSLAACGLPPRWRESTPAQHGVPRRQRPKAAR